MYGKQGIMVQSNNSYAIATPTLRIMHYGNTYILNAISTHKCISETSGLT